MKYLLLFAFFLSSCGTLEQIEQRNADLTVTYDEKLVHKAYKGPLKRWNSLPEVTKSLKDDEKPDFIIFSANWCSYCKILEQKINKKKYRNRVLILNVDEDWVSYIMKAMKIKKVPSMIVTFDNGGPKSRIFYGTDFIFSTIDYFLSIKR